MTYSRRLRCRGAASIFGTCVEWVVVMALIRLTLPVGGAGSPDRLRWTWQEPQAEVDPKGDLAWKPRPFVFEKGASVRYIDFEAGNDASAGDTTTQAWKHHPWDPQATAKAASETGIHTYVFKRGVEYRGRLIVKGTGKPDEPIRLTSDPSWGSGHAILSGAHQVTRWTRGATHKDIPEPEKVWWADLDFAPRCVWSVSADGRISRIPLARVPNWTVSNPDDVKSEWWVWNNPRRPFGNTISNARGQVMHLGIDTLHIKDKPEDYFKGAIIWPEFGWVMSDPYPTEVEIVDLKQHGLGFGGWTGGGTSGVIMRNMRYYLEDKPHYLDDPSGEFWFEKKREGGRIYLRPPGDTDPNDARIEAGRWMNLVDGAKVEHVHITGLTFRFTTPAWKLTAAPWDFSTRPWGFRSDMHPGAVRVWGEGQNIRVAHCRFEHVFFPICIRALASGQHVNGVRIEDNEFRYTDDGILSVMDGTGWGHADLRGRLGDVRVLRNSSRETGRRPARYGSGTGMEIAGARTVEIAGNVIERSYAQGIDVHGAKRNGVWGDVPFTRILIHHNKVWESMLNCNDYGGIETWQGGPAYVFNNLSYNALGYRHWNRHTGTDPGFGHAYYLDGAFKNYHFNNIAWGKAKDTSSPVVNCAAFQEIHSYQNTFFHNTVFNYHAGSRRQAPVAGRNKYLGNVWTGIGKHVFRHADPARTAAEGNADDAGPARDRYALESNAYGRNVFHDFSEMGVLEPSGRWLLTFRDFQAALRKGRALMSDLGVVSQTSPLRNPAHGDFRPHQDSAVAGQGVRVFVPWALSGVVGEWNFYPSGDDPTHLLDEHWRMTDYHVSREHYHKRPTYPLKGVNVTAADYVQGALEDWIAGALTFKPSKRTYAVLSNADMMKPFAFEDLRKSRHEGGGPEKFTIAGAALKNPQIHTSNLLIEVYFQTAPRHTGGVLLEKLKDSGYRLVVNASGGVTFSVKGASLAASVESKDPVNDGRWHHLVAEADRQAQTLTVYLDGRKNGTAPGLDASTSLANDGDLHVGGTPGGRWLDGTLDFLRIAQGTLADADTTIDELSAWQFDGPFLRDFAGRPASGSRRDAGAIMKTD